MVDKAIAYLDWYFYCDAGRESPTAVQYWEQLSKTCVRPTARWLPDRPHHFYCSACLTIEGIAATSMKYCPTCGAQMRVMNGEKSNG